MRPSQKIITALLLGLIMNLSSCTFQEEPEYVRQADFNPGWEYHMGDLAEGSDLAADTSSWSLVHLPHDWSIEDYQLQDALHQGPFFKDLPGGSDVGYLRDGIAWYRKRFETPKGLGEHRIVLDFDGVQTQMELWVNGRKTGEHVYGYTPFEMDITSALKEEGKLNIIAVKTINPGENSRWFAGAGIYRPVRISVLNPVSISPWGVEINTRELSAKSAIVELGVSVRNLSEVDSEISCEVEIIAPGGESIILPARKKELPGESDTRMDFSADLSNPMPWSVDVPDLYRAVATLKIKGKVIDQYETSFGIRSIKYTAEKGFLLNGKEILMKGACMHHDNGLLGAAAFPDAEYRRVRIMKENGYNAIRTSHNPPSRDFLDACDKLGMLVIDEAFDHWVLPKRPNDYSNYFEQWYKRDIQSMVYRDRNHPSVVMWSIGNEVQERADPKGIEIGKKLIAAIREVDDTRPVTQAVCDFWDKPGKDWDYSAGAFEILDISGYNYKYEEYESDHITYPDRIMYGSETFPLLAWENWEKVKNLSYVIGDFVWTGMDYLGESGIGHLSYVEEGLSGGAFLQPWPWYVSWCGDIDIIGNKKPQSYYRDVVWGESNMEMMVLAPVPEGKIARISRWGWPDELPSWNWEGHEGELLTVRVFTSYPQVKLELNGKEVGNQIMKPSDRYIAEFRVKYKPGMLKAVGFDGDKSESCTLETANAVSKIILSPEKEKLDAHENSLGYVLVEARDEDGNLAIKEHLELKVLITGEAKLLAAGNANPLHDGSFTDGKFKLFRGRGMIIVRSTGVAGDVGIEVISDSLGSSKLSFKAQ